MTDRRLATVLAAVALGVLAVPRARAAELSAAPSHSPTPPQPPPKPSSQARSLSRALVPQATWDRLLDRSAHGLSEAVSRSLATKGAAVPDGLEGKLRKELGQNLQYDAAVDEQAQALERRFSRSEMEDATKFYASPVGKKMLERLPEAQSEVSDHLQERLAVVVPDIVHRVAPALAQSGQGPSAGGSTGPQQAPRGGGAEQPQGVGAGSP